MDHNHNNNHKHDLKHKHDCELQSLNPISTANVEQLFGIHSPRPCNHHQNPEPQLLTPNPKLIPTALGSYVAFISLKLSTQTQKNQTPDLEPLSLNTKP